MSTATGSTGGHGGPARGLGSETEALVPFMSDASGEEAQVPYRLILAGLVPVVQHLIRQGDKVAAQALIDLLRLWQRHGVGLAGRNAAAGIDTAMRGVIADARSANPHRGFASVIGSGARNGGSSRSPAPQEGPGPEGPEVMPYAGGLGS